MSILALCLATLNPTLLWADEIYFTNGRKMQGRVLSDDGNKLELALPSGGTTTVNKTSIKNIQKSDPSEINVNFVDGQNSMLVDCVINNVKTATFVIDTGASLCMLTKKMGEDLGIDTTDPRYHTTIQIANGSSVPAFYTRLRSVKLQHIEAKDVEAVVLMGDVPPGIAFKDGLLGMSFLGRYSTHMDYSRKKFVIEA